jgi:hypothetical protein
MCDSDQDQTQDILKELFTAERHQEIKQLTTMQGQIVALVIILKSENVLSKESIDQWETLSENTANLMYRMARANEVISSENEEDPTGQIETMIDGMDATLEFSRLMGNDEEKLSPLQQQRDALAEKLEELLNDG